MMHLLLATGSTSGGWEHIAPAAVEFGFSLLQSSKDAEWARFCVFHGPIHTLVGFAEGGGFDVRFHGFLAFIDRCIPLQAVVE